MRQCNEAIDELKGQVHMCVVLCECMYEYVVGMCVSVSVSVSVCLVVYMCVHACTYVHVRLCEGWVPNQLPINSSKLLLEMFSNV